MYQIDFSKPNKVFFCGIGGISMSGLAEILIDKGFTVCGSDRSASPLTDTLSSKGAAIFIGQKEENVTDDIDIFVYTAAISKEHPEYQRAVLLNIPILTRAELLGQIMKNYPLPIAVSGTHGKTTVTGMLSDILLNASKDPTISIGGILPSIESNIRIGHSDVFVTEACEYTNSFLSFFPKASIILNVEEDHLDFFKDINDIENSFHRFASLCPSDGILVIGGDIPGKDKIIKDIAAKVITFGKDASSDYYPTDITYGEDGLSYFNIVCPNHDTEQFTLKVPGYHNILNASAAIAMADYIGIDRSIIKQSLANFGGTKRRFEIKGTLNGFTIIDDYAHHPSEIRATLSAAANYPHKKLWVIFQPHTYSRTKAFLNDFAKALSLADAIILADIYAAREKDTLGISSKDITDLLQNDGKESYYFPTFDQIINFVKENCAPGDVLITMGAGDVVNIADTLSAK